MFVVDRIPVLIWSVVLSIISVTYVNLVEPTDSDLDFIAPEDDDEESADGGMHREDVVMNTDVAINADDVDSEDEEEEEGDEDASPPGVTSGVDADVRAHDNISYIPFVSLHPVFLSSFLIRSIRKIVTRHLFRRAASLPVLRRGFGCRCRLIRQACMFLTSVVYSLSVVV